MTAARRKYRMAVLGGGRLAIRVTQLLMHTGADVRVWARGERAREELRGAFKKVPVSGDIAEVCADVEVVLFAVPANALKDVANQYAPHARGDHVVLHCCRGVAEGFVLPSQAIRSVTCVRKIGALGGPLYFDDASRERPMVAVLASSYDEAGETLKALVAGTPVRVHLSRDVVGVEVAGAISNVAALASGMADALDMGETARGVILTRGLSEATRLGMKLGADLATFSGLAGVGDLIPRHVSSTKRHRDVGAQVAGGMPLEAALQGASGCVEGVLTASEAATVADRLNLRLPLIKAVDDILHARVQARGALEEILKLDIELEREVLSARG